jgi:putative SOS response-associated peptidase YedK
MCSNYMAVTSADLLLKHFGVQRLDFDGPPEVWPLGQAPFIRLAEDGSGNLRCDDGVYGLLPHFAAEKAFGRKTYNARSETVASKPSFREAWRKGQRCIIPAQIIFEPCWETGKPVRWAIQMPGQVPMGIAGIWSSWKDADDKWHYTFAMLTVNADGHPVMQRMHRPGDEKRMVVILHEHDYGRWLSCPVADAPSLFKQWTGPLDALPAPLSPRARRTKSDNPSTKELLDDDPHLFD